MPAMNRKIKATVKNSPFAISPHTATTKRAMPAVFLNFHDRNPRTMAKADSQKTVAPLFAMASSPKTLPNTVTMKPLANPNSPPNIDNTATHTFIRHSPFGYLTGMVTVTVLLAIVLSLKISPISSLISLTPFTSNVLASGTS